MKYYLLSIAATIVTGLLIVPMAQRDIPGIGGEWFAVGGVLFFTMVWAAWMNGRRRKQQEAPRIRPDIRPEQFKNKKPAKVFTIWL